MKVPHYLSTCPRCKGKGAFSLPDGYAMRKMRERAGVSLRQMAKRIGISAPYLGDVELGRKNCTAKIERAYAKL